MTDQPIIAIRDLHKSYGPAKVLRGCSLSIARGEVVVVCGPSGSGKSTLIKCINGLEGYQSGSILVDGIEVGAKGSDLPKLRARVGMVFQHFELYPHMSVLNNIALAQVHVLKRTRAVAHERARELLTRVGLQDKADAIPADLSGGQQQRVAIARALALDPQASVAQTYCRLADYLNLLYSVEHPRGGDFELFEHVEIIFVGRAMGSTVGNVPREGGAAILRYYYPTKGKPKRVRFRRLSREYRILVKR